MLPNTRAVGFFGLTVGGGSIVLSIGALFKLCSDPHYLVQLAHAIGAVRAHAATDDNWFAIAQLAGAFVAIVGSTVVAILASYYGRPSKISDDPKPTPPVSGT